MAGRSPHPGPDSPPLSSQAWVHDALLHRIRKAVPALTAELAPWRPRCIFLGGSAALGEAVGWEPADEAQRCLLSDLDLGIVTLDRVPPPAREAAVRQAGLAPGYYLDADQPRQTPTPGLVEIGRRARLVWGEVAVLDRFVTPEEHRIPEWEAWRLVGNRCLELRTSWNDRDREGPSPRAWYAVAKLAEALFAARLIRQGGWRIGRAGRLALLDAAGSGSARVTAAVDPVTHAARLWRPFLLLPCEAHRPPERGLEEVRVALTAWLREAGAGGEPVDRFLEEPVTRRERFRRWKDEARDSRRGGPRAALWALWKALQPGLGTPEGRRMREAAVYWRQPGEGTTGRGPRPADVDRAGTRERT